MNWSDLSEWWVGELESDSAYEQVVTPLLIEVLDPERGGLYLDLGCGEGRVMRTLNGLGARVHGVDGNFELAARAEWTVVAELPELPLRTNSYEGTYSVLTLEHLADHRHFFSEAARVTKAGGVLAIVINHPVWTAPGSTPITDTDGEVLWRPGDYFSDGHSEVPAGRSIVRFHHRSMAELLNGASAAGWALQRMRERPHHELPEQSGIPRLLGCRWILLPTPTMDGQARRVISR